MNVSPIRQARVHARFLATTPSADFHAVITAAIHNATDSAVMSDHGHGPTPITTEDYACPADGSRRRGGLQSALRGEMPIGSGAALDRCQRKARS
jgi:hypothetical protein